MANTGSSTTPSMASDTIIDVPRPAMGRLRPPELPGDLVLRPLVVQHLHEGMTSRALTLVSAPAGYGKTSAMVQALSGVTPRAAWVTLDPEDDDPVSFVYTISAALAASGRDHRAMVHEMLRHGLVPPRRVVERLAEAMDQEHCVLVLDELEVVTSAEVHGLIEHLLAMAPTIRIAATSRRDPPLSLARLRARGQLLEVRVRHLRFSQDEGTELLLGHGHRLSPGVLEQIHAELDGWPAGYRLAVAALDQAAASGDAEDHWKAMVRSGRFAVEFLGDEVISGLEPGLRVFLTETAILDRLDAVTCDSVTGTGDAGAWLQQIDATGLFVSRVEAGVLRLHPLFRNGLLEEFARLDADRRAVLHERAGAALASRLPEAAIHHFLEAGHFDRATALIEERGGALLREGLTTTLERWLDLVPLATLATRPRLRLLRAACLFEQGDVTAAVPVAREAHGALEAVGDDEGRSQATALLATAAVWQDDVVRARPLIELALSSQIPPSDRVNLLVGRARIAFLDRRWVEAGAALDDAIRTAADHAGPDVLYGLMYLHPMLALLPNGPELVERACTLVETRLGPTLPVLPIRVLHAGHTGFLLLLRGRLDEAAVATGEGLAMLQRLGADAGAVGMILGMTAVSVHSARGDRGAVEGLLQLVLHVATEAGISDAQIPGALYLLGRLRLRDGHIDEASSLHDRMAAAVEENRLPGAPVLRAMLGGLLESSVGDFQAARTSLEWALRHEGERRASLLFGAAAPLLADVHRRAGDEEASLQVLERFFAQSFDRGLPGLVLREGPELMVPLLHLAVGRGARPGISKRLLAAFGAESPSTPTTIPGTPLSITAREAEVVRLIARGWTNQQIGEELYLSVHTVKRHVANILAKLGVRSRTAAVARARELGIL